MKLSDFDYDLPKELIAQEGLANRDEAKLLVLNSDGSLEHSGIKHLSEFFRAGDMLILNDTRVTRSKLLGKKESGGKIDCMVLPDGASGKIREALLRGSRVKPGINILFENSGQIALRAKVLERVAGAKYRIEFDNPGLLEHFGQLPLPPYIKKPLENQERYQTVYSRENGSLAAPTAGLHFTPDMLSSLAKNGVNLVYLTLHVGIGTFAPIHAENVEDWKMHAEYYNVPVESAGKINNAIKTGKRIFAVGTTSVRTLETTTENGNVTAGEGWTDIYIYPGYNFKVPYAGMLTNFHLPESTLFLLACAFAGKERLLQAYEEAIKNKYRFYSLGDSTLILR